MRIDRFQELTQFDRAGQFYLSGEGVLVRLIESGRDALSLRRETSLLTSLNLPCLPTLLEAGMDQTLGRLYYAMRVDSRVKPLHSGVFYPAQTIPFLEQLARDIAQLHDMQVVYRKLGFESIALVDNGTPLLYDVSLAARFGYTRAVPRLTEATEYPAPESLEDEYDGVRADIFAYGRLASGVCRSAGVSGDRLAMLLAQMTATQPRDRPVSMAGVLQQLGEL